MNLKINNFIVDSNLMYLIQKVTNESTENVLMYFYTLSMSIAEEAAAKIAVKPGKRTFSDCIRKTMRWHYKDSAIPYKLEITGNIYDFNGNPIPNAKLWVSVNFPKSRNNVDVAQMMDRVVENAIGLDGSEPLPKFKAPQTRIPQGFRKYVHE